MSCLETIYALENLQRSSVVATDVRTCALPAGWSQMRASTHRAWTDCMLPVQGLALSTFQVVLVPTIVGVLTNEFFPGVVKKLKSVLPLVGVALTTLLCASPCAQVATILR